MPSDIVSGFKGVTLNICGRAAERVPQLLEAYPDFDFYVCLETMWEDGSWGQLNFDGFLFHHCTRPYDGRGRQSGGVLVLLRESSPLFNSGVRVHVDPASGLVWVHVDRHRLTFVFVYFSPFSSELYRKGVLNKECLSTFIDGLATAKARGHRIVCMGDFNIRTGCMSDDVVGPDIDLGPDIQLGLGPQPGVPPARVSMDSRVPDRNTALLFLLGL